MKRQYKIWKKTNKKQHQRDKGKLIISYGPSVPSKSAFQPALTHTQVYRGSPHTDVLLYTLFVVPSKLPLLIPEASDILPACLPVSVCLLCINKHQPERRFQQSAPISPLLLSACLHRRSSQSQTCVCSYILTYMSEGRAVMCFLKSLMTLSSAVRNTRQSPALKGICFSLSSAACEERQTHTNRSSQLR